MTCGSSPSLSIISGTYAQHSPRPDAEIMSVQTCSSDDNEISQMWLGILALASFKDVHPIIPFYVTNKPIFCHAIHYSALLES